MPTDLELDDGVVNLKFVFSIVLLNCLERLPPDRAFSFFLAQDECYQEEIGYR
jgi:hypothetical protein